MNKSPHYPSIWRWKFTYIWFLVDNVAHCFESLCFEGNCNNRAKKSIFFPFVFAFPILDNGFLILNDVFPIYLKMLSIQFNIVLLKRVLNAWCEDFEERTLIWFLFVYYAKFIFLLIFFLRENIKNLLFDGCSLWMENLGMNLFTELKRNSEKS